MEMFVHVYDIRKNRILRANILYADCAQFMNEIYPAEKRVISSRTKGNNMPTS